MKVAKLVAVTLMTRVIVDVNAEEEEIVAAAKAGFQAKIDNDELIENVESIVEDKEMPYKDPDSTSFECSGCGKTHEKNMYAIAQIASGNAITHSCDCGTKNYL